MNPDLFDRLVKTADEKYDGHFMLLKFTTEWRCCLGTIDLINSAYTQVKQMPQGKTADEAMYKALDPEAADADWITKTAPPIESLWEGKE